jgi:transcriptional regulator with XRE-family HTH domain
MNTGERIKNLRLAHGLTQTELAKAAHVSFQTIYKYEAGIITNIPLTKIQLIADALEVDPAQIMGWKDEPEDDLYELRERLRRQPGLRLLFSTTKNATDKDLLKVAKMIEMFKEDADGR